MSTSAHRHMGPSGEETAVRVCGGAPDLESPDPEGSTEELSVTALARKRSMIIPTTHRCNIVLALA